MQRILTEAPGRYTRRGLPRGCLVTSGDAGTEDAGVRAAMSRIREGKTARLRDRIEADAAAERLPPGTDATGLAGYVMSVLSGLVQRAREGATRRELESIASVAARALP